jgi:hypothetical protein
MTPRGQRRAGQPPAATAPTPLRSIARPSPAFVSPTALRRAIEAYAETEGLGPAVTTNTLREGVALGLVIAGLATQMPSTAGAPWARAVPTTYARLQALTGLDQMGLRAALEGLAGAGVLRRADDAGGLTLTVYDERVWAPHPALSAAPWSALAAALARAGAPVRAALVVFAELALRTEAAWRAQTPVGPIVGDALDAAGTLPAPTAWLEVTLKTLADRVHYHRSHVDNALAGLETAGCLTRLRGTTRATSIRLAAWTVGAAPIPDVDVPAAPAETAASLVPVPPPAASVGGSLPVGLQAEAPSVTLVVNGVPIPLPPGVTPQLERDAAGRRWYRVGGMLLGPLPF